MARHEPVFSPDAVRQFKKLRTYDQRVVVDGVQKHLVDAEPDETTRNKFRLRHLSDFADYELRLGDLRLFYRIEASGEVVVTLIGAKEGSLLIVEGEEFEL